MTRDLISFALVTLIPVAGLWAAILLGSPWGWLTLVYMTGASATLDMVLPRGRDQATTDPRWADALALLLGTLHFTLLFGTLWGLTASTLSGIEKLPLFLAAGLYMGQVSNSIAHELIHRPQRLPRRLGQAIYTSLLFGHHTTAHPGIHHRHVATPKDPNTSRLGEGYYRFFYRAWRGSFRAGARLESDRLEKQGHSRRDKRHPYYRYFTGALITLVVALWIGGPSGGFALFALALFAQSQLMLSDYVQHYGLVRAEIAPGKYEPVRDQHSWNAPHWFTARLMLNAPRHSDHHAHPSKTFADLSYPPPETGPELPYPLPVMATIALWPQLWKRVMLPYVTKWRPDLQER